MCFLKPNMVVNKSKIKDFEFETIYLISKVFKLFSGKPMEPCGVFFKMDNINRRNNDV